MAIIVEEEKTKSNGIAIVAWLVFLLVIVTAGYYLFIAAPTPALLPTTGALSTLAPIASTTLQPQTVMNTAAFQALHSTVANPTPQGPVPVNRPNPFINP